MMDMSTNTQTALQTERDGVKPSRFNRVCVYCGSGSGKGDSYREVTIELAQELAARGIGVIYGGGSNGLMGLIAQTVDHAGGNVIGVLPSALAGKLIGETFGEERVVDNMHMRKAELDRLADCFITLPGGYGTFAELLEIISFAQLGIHDKPLGVLNINGFYDSLLSLIDKAIEEGFIMPFQRDIIVCASTVKELIQKLEEYVPVRALVAKERWEVDQKMEKQLSNGV